MLLNRKLVMTCAGSLVILFPVLSHATVVKQITIPTPYVEGQHKSADGTGIHIITRETNKNGHPFVVYAYGVFNQPPQDQSSMWFTECSYIANNGSSGFRCIIDQKGFNIMVKSNESLVYFKEDKTEFKAQEVRYKLDQKPIVTEKNAGVMGSRADALLMQLAEAKSFTYTWTFNNQLKTQQLNMTGFKEAYAFAQKMVAANK